MAEGAMSIFLGQTGSGKTTYMLSLLKRRRREFDGVYLISPTESKTHTFKDVIPSKNIFTRYNEKIITTVQSHQDKKLENGESCKKKLIIIDDMIGVLNFKKGNTCKLFTSLAVSGRHSNIEVWLSTQYSKKIDPCIRANSHWVIFRSSLPQIEELWNIVPSSLDFYSKSQWVNYVKNVTSSNNNYDCVILNPFGSTKNLKIDNAKNKK